MKSISNLNLIMYKDLKNTECSDRYFDTDSPIGRFRLCYPHLKVEEVEKRVDKHKRKLYRRWIPQDARNMSTYEMQKIAIKNSYYSSYELDILIVNNIDNEFREEIHSMYTISMQVIDNSSIQDIHNLIKDMELIEDAYGRRTKTTVEELSDETLYKNKINYTTDYSPR